MKISLESLLQHLASRGAAIARSSGYEKDGAPAPTSIRLKPATRHFLECQATVLNTSVQSLISTILDGVAEMTTDQTSGTLRTIRERFFFLFRSHRIDLPGIVSIMKEHGITLSTLESAERLLDRIDKDSIKHIAQTFFVRPEWISGASDSVIDLGINVRWYKNVHGMGSKLLNYATQGLKPHVMFIRRERANFATAKEDNDSGGEVEPIGVVVRLTRKTDQDVSFTVYETWVFERWNYWRCREQIKLLIAFCDQTRGYISYSGYELPAEDIKALTSCGVLPIGVMERINSVSWYPDDYACIRDSVTKEVDEWPGVLREYEAGKFDELIREARGR